MTQLLDENVKMQSHSVKEELLCKRSQEELLQPSWKQSTMKCILKCATEENCMHLLKTEPEGKIVKLKGRYELIC